MGQHIAHREEVAQGLRHLFIINIDKAVVHPDVDKGFARFLSVGAFRLGNFIFVMGELQVGTTAMNVELLAQKAAAHGRTLNMPARSAKAVGRRPDSLFGLFGLGALPEYEVQRVALAFGDGNPLTCSKLVDRLAREPAVAWETAHGIVHITRLARAVRVLIGMAIGLKPLNKLEHF